MKKGSLFALAFAGFFVFLGSACEHRKADQTVIDLGGGGALPAGTTGMTNRSDNLEGETSISVIKEKLVLEEGAVTAKTIYEYNEEGELVKEINQELNSSGVFIDQGTIDYNYAENRITSTSRAQFDLDDKNRVKAVTVFSPVDPAKAVSKTEVDYPETDGRPITIRNFIADAAGVFPSTPNAVDFLEYDERGFVLKKTTRAARSPETVKQNTYDDEGYVNRMESQSGSQAPMVSNYENLYDSEGRLISQKEIMDGGGYHAHLLFSYDAQGNVTSRCSDEDADGGVFTECVIYSYVLLSEKPILSVLDPTKRAVEMFDLCIGGGICF